MRFHTYRKRIKTKTHQCGRGLNRGNWLGNPANFKGPAYCFALDVEMYLHASLDVHSLSDCSDGGSDIILLGDYFEAILAILEEDDALKDEFYLYCN